MVMSNAERQAKYRAARSERLEERVVFELPADVRHGLVALAEYHGLTMKDVLIGLVRNAHQNQFKKTTETAYQDWADAEASLFLKEAKAKR